MSSSNRQVLEQYLAEGERLERAATPEGVLEFMRDSCTRVAVQRGLIRALVEELRKAESLLAAHGIGPNPIFRDRFQGAEGVERRFAAGEFASTGEKE